MVETAFQKMLEQRYCPRRIIPIGGGGIIPAAMLTYQLYRHYERPIEQQPPLYVKSYDNDPEHGQHEAQFAEQNSVAVFDEADTLFVDEICDSGQTFRFLRQYYPRCTYLALVTKNDEPNFSAVYDTRKYWWVFPWEE